MFLATPVVRGCGVRQKGGVYVECGHSPFGKPVDDFLLDPPIPLSGGIDIPKQGIGWLEHGGVWHMVDHVGSIHYPNVADFIEEVRLFGLSRRVPRNIPFDRLTQGGRILLVHGRAIITNPELVRPTGDGAMYRCPKHIPEHVEGADAGCCAGMWWEDLIDGVLSDDAESRLVTRTMPSFEYNGRAHIDGVKYEAGMFASFPVTGIAVVKDTDGDTHLDAMKRAEAAGVRVVLVDE